jgi:hypothetical protein
LELNMEYLRDFVEEHPHVLGMAGCAAVAAVVIATGGLKYVQEAQEKGAIASATAKQQEKAEEVYNANGCSAQVISQNTPTTGITSGDIVLDPLTGAKINSGFVCSADGSIFSVNDGVATLIGTSPKIRKVLANNGTAAKAVEMSAYAQVLRQRAQNSSNPVAPVPSPTTGVDPSTTGGTFNAPTPTR